MGQSSVKSGSMSIPRTPAPVRVERTQMRLSRPKVTVIVRCGSSDSRGAKRVRRARALNPAEKVVTRRGPAPVRPLKTDVVEVAGLAGAIRSQAAGRRVTTACSGRDL